MVIYMLITIQLMLYFLCMAHGDSTAFYGGQQENEHPFQGVCQGNGGGPALFLSISAPCVKMLHRQAFTATFRGALLAVLFTLVGLLHVDDTDLIICALNDTKLLYDIFVHMQKMILCWHGGLCTTGGSLNPDKCSWAPISFNWDLEGQFHYQEDIATNMLVPDIDGTPKVIDRLGPHEAVEVVSIWQAVDGNMAKQVEVLKEKATKLGNMIQ